ncbi:LysR family transcriptional regulator [Allokutzneria oryzae]|uniref:LysR family transcriptional regulator n=1 Tax=Allokutzneria oryzae TaxID=1378989 RepID=A0ABV6A791_9PSEU
MTLPDLDLLATFLEVHRGGSLTVAATRRGLSQPAVTGQLARLERQVGEPLFVRTRRGVVPTERGDALARAVGPHLDQLSAALRADSGVPSGVVRVGGAAELLALRVLPTLAPLAVGGLSLRVVTGLAQPLLAALAEGELDLVVSAIKPPGNAFAATPLADEEFILVGPVALARTVDRALLASDPAAALSHLPLVAYAEDLPIVRRYWRTEFGRRPPNPVSVVVPDLRAVLAAVVAGAGVSALPRYLAEPALAGGSVEVLHEPQVQPLNTLYLAVRRGGLTDPATALAHDHLLAKARTWGAL